MTALRSARVVESLDSAATPNPRPSRNHPRPGDRTRAVAAGGELGPVLENAAFPSPEPALPLHRILSQDAGLEGRGDRQRWKPGQGSPLGPESKMVRWGCKECLDSHARADRGGSRVLRTHS
ncbi:uncharacterized protein LOC128928112 [Callithrix jacchus]